MFYFLSLFTLRCLMCREQKLSYFSFLGILMISASLYLIGLLHGIFWLKEPKPHSENVKKKAMIIDIFNYQNIIDPFKLLCTSSPGNNRLVICLVMFLIFIITGICQGKTILLKAFHFSLKKCSIFS